MLTKRPDSRHQLKPFTAQDYSLLMDWVTDEEFNLLWGGPVYQFPLTLHQIERHVSRPEVHPYLFQAAGQTKGYIELYQSSPKHCRLCRVLVANESDRGKGYGRMLLDMAVEKAESEFGAEVVSLSVFEHNFRAVNCYRGMGFEIYQADRATRVFNGEPWTLLQMKKLL
ncbi:GNAT family N-acetyltransferase [Photobacterium halotolerans]|uniref:GNAT family N-acetyltransferase n=1 Tax=Photobacterium halotolerans TaxID=265726 RepID=A0A7X4W9A5_9GAMM|nr:GNAT family N-acetyltransferase [Photobacterium halotolerans]NAW64569.1 GNAT family N-acetyltransferase [Photobacterium halotolerans]NAW86911.1 GNAT family N-acetyltransferase [Photobacterium halotolerans]NAX46971.1 GNAT family N-acetyltransferase [Photobacterium halotolerans]